MKNEDLVEYIKRMQHGLYLMSREREAALSTHATFDLIAEMQQDTEKVLAQVDKS